MGLAPQVHSDQLWLSTQRGAELTKPGPVAVGVGHLERHAPVEGDGAVAAGPRPGVNGAATEPASTSNSARIGAAPRRRRRSRKALADGVFRPHGAAVSLAHTVR
jgi:hypothetical protein